MPAVFYVSNTHSNFHCGYHCPHLINKPHTRQPHKEKEFDPEAQTGKGPGKDSNRYFLPTLKSRFILF
jgi:hypothetical protein